MSKLRNEYSHRILISELYQNRSLKIWVCDRKIDWTALSLVFVQAKVKFVSLIMNFRRMSSSQYNQIAWGYMVK